jgi:hypothetical protein
VKKPRLREGKGLAQGHIANPQTCRAEGSLQNPGWEYFLLYPALKQFHWGGSSAVLEETSGLSRIRSKAVFQDLPSRLSPQGTAVGKSRQDIDYGQDQWLRLVRGVRGVRGSKKGWERQCKFL